MKAAIHLDLRHTDNLEVCKNSEFEDIESLFNITKKLISENSETLNVNSIESTSLSWTRSTLLNDRALKWTKARVHVYSDSVLCLGKIHDSTEAPRQWNGQVAELRMQICFLGGPLALDGEPIERRDARSWMRHHASIINLPLDVPKPPRKPDFALIKKKAGLLQPCPESDGLPHWASLDQPADIWIHHANDMIPEAWDFAVTSCLRPAARNPGPTTTSTQNFAEYENLRRTFHDTANPRHRNGLRFTPSGLRWTRRRRGRLSTQPGHQDLPPAPAHSTTSVFALVQPISSSLHGDSARAILRGVRLAASTDAPLPLSPDDWWPASDDSDPDAWSTDPDSFAEMSDVTTMT